MKVLHVITPTMRGLIDYRVARARENMMMVFARSQLEREGGPEYELYTGDIAGEFIVDARNAAAISAIQGQVVYLWPPADYLVMIDDDMLPPPDALVKLMAHEEGDIVVPLFHQRGSPYDAVILEEFAVEDDKEDGVGYKMTPVKHGEFQEVDAAGFGLVKINVHTTFKRMQSPFFLMPDEHAVGEDVYFCHKARHQAGARIFCDTTIDVGHLTTMPSVINTESSQALKATFKLPEVAPVKMVERWLPR